MCVALPGLRSRRCRHKCCTLLPLLLPFMLSGQPPLNNYAQLTIKNYSSWYQKVYTLYIVLKIALVQLLNNRSECRIFTLFMDNTTYAENFLVKVGTLKSLENQRP